MRLNHTETVIKCDACNQEIFRPMVIGRETPNYSSIEELDICEVCVSIILETLYSRQKFTKEELTDAFRPCAISARAHGYVLY